MENLTQRELEFLETFLENNNCAAGNPQELLEDNFSCQCLEDLDYVFENLTKKQIGGFLSSLQEKDIIELEKRDGSICKSKSRLQQMNFEPDLYWVNDSFLEKNQELKTFKGLK